VNLKVGQFQAAGQDEIFKWALHIHFEAIGVGRIQGDHSVLDSPALVDGPSFARTTLKTEDERRRCEGWWSVRAGAGGLSGGPVELLQEQGAELTAVGSGAGKPIRA